MKAEWGTRKGALGGRSPIRSCLWGNSSLCELIGGCQRLRSKILRSGFYCWCTWRAQIALSLSFVTSATIMAFDAEPPVSVLPTKLQLTPLLFLISEAAVTGLMVLTRPVPFLADGRCRLLISTAPPGTNIARFSKCIGNWGIQAGFPHPQTEYGMVVKPAMMTDSQATSASVTNGIPRFHIPQGWDDEGLPMETQDWNRTSKLWKKFKN